MHHADIDACFHLAAHGNKEAYQKLYNEFRRRAELRINIIVSQMTILSGNPIDFSDLIDSLFFKLINEYNYDRGSFSNFMEYTFSHRLTSKVQSVAFAYQNQIAAIGSNNDFQTIETLADPTQRTIQEEIALKNFKTRISSPNRNKKLVDRTMDKILAMQYAGLSTKEICERLNLSPARYRNYIKKIQDDDRVINFKLEMK